MSLNFEIKKKHVARSERVKSVELHSEYTWVLSGLYSGVITIQDYSNQTIVKQIDQKQNEVNRQAFEAHTDYIRCVIVHPSQPYLITSSDDTTIKLWDIDNNFTLLRTFEDHVNYVMMVAYNPRDPNTFASASMDNTVKVWTIRIANLISHLISDGDDRSIKIWDCQTKQCIHTLEAHQQNISSAKFHTDLPLIISQLLKTESLDSGIQIRTNQKHHSIIIWKEFGVQIQEKIIHQPFLTMKEHQPIVSMQQGKVVDGKNFQFFTINLKAINNTSNDGQIIQTNSKELGISDIYPCGVRHSPNGHLFAIFSDSEYTIYSSQNFKNSGFGSGTDLIWSSNGDYANNTLSFEMKTEQIIDQLFAGPVLCAKFSDFIMFYDWETGKLIRRIDFFPNKVILNDTNTIVALATNDEVAITNLLQQEENSDGFEDAFQPLCDTTESINSGYFIQDVFYYTTMNGKIAYSVNGKIFIVDQDKKYFIIRYIQQQNKLYLIDKNIILLVMKLIAMSLNFKLGFLKIMYKG